MYGPNPAPGGESDRPLLAGDRTAGLETDPDGGLTIYLQPDSPGEGREAKNWLPCPNTHGWFLILRMYLPRPEVIEAKWAIKRQH